MLDAGQVALVVPEDGVEVTQRVVVDVSGDPVTHRAVQSRQLTVVLITAAAGGGALSCTRPHAIGRLSCHVSAGFGDGGAVKHQP